MHIDSTFRPVTPRAGSQKIPEQRNPLPAEVNAHLAAGASLLKALRLWRSMPAKTLASQSGLPAELIEEFEAGRQAVMGSSRRAIARTLQVPETWFDLGRR
jgi:hypothetical protein